jgi:hypothetical protein
LQVERAVLTVDINAASRPFEIFVETASGTRVQAKQNSPIGTLHFPIEPREAALLQPDRDGGIKLGIAVGEAQRLLGEKSASSEWRISNLELALTGRTLEP